MNPSKNKTSYLISNDGYPGIIKCRTHYLKCCQSILGRYLLVKFFIVITSAFPFIIFIQWNSNCYLPVSYPRTLQFKISIHLYAGTHYD